MHKPLPPCRPGALTSLLAQVAFVRNRDSKVVYDRRFNTAALMKEYYGDSLDFSDRWAPGGGWGQTGQG